MCAALILVATDSVKSNLIGSSYNLLQQGLGNIEDRTEFAGATILNRGSASVLIRRRDR
jgi:hypothetical protein